jgi:hypothetical protein
MIQNSSSNMDTAFAAPTPSILDSATATSFEMPATTASDSATGLPEESFLRSPIFIGVVVIIALAIVGFNVFSYLGTGTEFVATGIMPLIERVTGDLSLFVSKFTDNTTTGTKGAVDVAGGTVKAGAAVPHEIIAGTKGTVVSQQNMKKIDTTSAASAGSTRPEQADPSNELQNTLDSATAQTQPAQGAEPESANAKSSGPGYCYIGEDQGFRSCISVSDSTKCMSGDVFANLDACQREP